MGGDSAKEQMRALQEGVDIVCGTPGRLNDLISTGKLDLSGVSRPQRCFLYVVNCTSYFLTDSLLCS